MLASNQARKALSAVEHPKFHKAQSRLPYSLGVPVWLTSPQIRVQLEQAFESAQLDGQNHSWVALEQIPCLYGVINETLRLSYGICCRLARIARTEDLVYRQKGGPEYFVPRGTPIGMSSYLTHHDEDIFPSSHESLPERWIMPNGERNTALEKHLVPLGKGSRICLGM